MSFSPPIRCTPQAEALLKAAGDLRIASAPDPETLLREGAGAEIVIVRARIPPAFFQLASMLRAVIRHGAGIDMIPYDTATAAGVLIANVPGANALTVAEHVLMVSLALLRQFRPMDRDLRNIGWSAGRAHSDRALDLAGRTMGIVGMGSVGKAVFRIAKYGFGLEIVANSRAPASLPHGVRFVSVDDLVSTADIVVLCCPLTPETTGLVSRDRIARMKPGTILVNVSRGPVVDDAALIQALEGGPYRGRGARRVLHPAPAARTSLLQAQQCDRDASSRRHYRGEHDADGDGSCGGSHPRLGRRVAH